MSVNYRCWHSLIFTSTDEHVFGPYQHRSKVICVFALINFKSEQIKKGKATPSLPPIGKRSS